MERQALTSDIARLHSMKLRGSCLGIMVHLSARYRRRLPIREMTARGIRPPVRQTWRCHTIRESEFLSRVSRELDSFAGWFRMGTPAGTR